MDKVIWPFCWHHSFSLQIVGSCLQAIFYQHFQTYFFSETTELIKVKFHVEHLWLMETKDYIIGPGHMTRMATMPTYSKTPLKIIYSYKLDGHETWYKASGT